MASAQERLRASRASLDAGFPSSAVSAAYYAMLYAARAALSEEERNAKTHRGVWSLFSEVFVTSGRFERELFAAAQRAQDLREAADYEAGIISPERPDAVLVDSGRFVAAVASMLPD
jgi:uncharacterized protein (UPF0332 family)